MLVGAAGNSRLCHGKIGHCRHHQAIQLVEPEQLRKPAPVIRNFVKGRTTTSCIVPGV